MLRFNYKILPLAKPHPAYPGEASTWIPLLPVRLSYGHGKRPFALKPIDSGAADTLFRADIGAPMGIKVDKGIHSTTSGIVPGQQIDVYFHDVNLRAIK